MREIAPGVIEYGPAGSASPSVATVTMRQAKLALHAAGLLSAVEAAIGALDEPARTVAQIEWQSGSVVERNSPTVALLASAASLSDSQLDDLFAQAATL